MVNFRLPPPEEPEFRAYPTVPRPHLLPPSRMEDPDQTPPAQPLGTESGSTPLPPRKLRPPGDEKLESENPDPNAEGGHLYSADGHDLGEAHEVLIDERTGERMFIVGEGEVVHAAEKPPATKEKLIGRGMLLLKTFSRDTKEYNCVGKYTRK